MANVYVLQLAGALFAFLFVGGCALWRQSWLRLPESLNG